jgi:hypothetical protein
MLSSPSHPDEELVPYEIERKARIAENQYTMQRLGLGDPLVPVRPTQAKYNCRKRGRSLDVGTKPPTTRNSKIAIMQDLQVRVAPVTPDLASKTQNETPMKDRNSSQAQAQSAQNCQTLSFHHADGSDYEEWDITTSIPPSPTPLFNNSPDVSSTCQFTCDSPSDSDGESHAPRSKYHRRISWSEEDMEHDVQDVTIPVHDHDAVLDDLPITDWLQHTQEWALIQSSRCVHHPKSLTFDTHEPRLLLPSTMVEVLPPDPTNMLQSQSQQC